MRKQSGWALVGNAARRRPARTFGILSPTQARFLFACWTGHGRTVFGLAVWAAVLIELACLLAVADGEVLHPYRVEIIEGSLSVMRAPSEAACVAEATDTIACIKADDEYPSR